MKIIVTIAAIGICSVLATSIYTKKFTTLSGTEVAVSQYQGKKILLVNIASNSPYAITQLPQLQQLYQTYKDSLVVVAFPSNNFGNEPKTNEQLRLLLKHSYKIKFPVSIIANVKDSIANPHPVYKWLHNKPENGITNISIKQDFQKILLDKSGIIIGIFSASTKPMDKVLTDAVKQ
jgi:glutathione peroxidase